MVKQEKGFTLVEVIASIVIIGLVLVSVAQLITQSNTVAQSNNEKLVVIDLADAVLEHIKNEDYRVQEAINNAVDKTAPNILIPLDTLVIDGIHSIQNIDNHKTIFYFEGQHYEVDASIIKCPESAEKLGLKNVKVTVRHVNVKSDVKLENLTVITNDQLEYLNEKSEIEGFVKL